jgi:hypothetical protein
LREIDLGGGAAGERVETGPPALEFLLVGFGAVLGDGRAGHGGEVVGPE